ncbi:GPW/gp25 family protein [Rhizobium leguminosarum]|uniref:GPW/gp25 family protein n=1 Tax=Rhizobium leguminosarum TaxID=384 RepID=UPI000B92AAF9|nr:GPW/gp25 family protein [Rhizobium leguminosarum]ASS56883.1 baseplate assembly protein [Rhizobium leguminosarum bv. viciae]
MTDSTGVNAETGAALSDWDHTQQSIAKILTTPIGTRVVRRNFGSDLYDLVDLKMTRRNILAIYSASAAAIARWEPRFRMRRGQVLSLAATGRIELVIIGTYFPRGHLGDYSIAEDRTTRIAFTS